MNNNVPEEKRDLKKPSVVISKDHPKEKKKHIKKEGRTIYEILTDEINRNPDMTDDEKVAKLDELAKIQEMKVNILIVGPAGVGKSSTINSLFEMNVATVGEGVDPETDSLTRYDLNNLRLYDTPGFGDGIKDVDYAKMVEKKLNDLDKNGDPLIDLVLVILDAGSKDLGTSMSLINDTIIPNLGRKAEDRVLIALNQADVAMKGRHWDEVNNKPDAVLTKYLKDKAESVRRRISEATGVDTCPIYYAAGYTENGVQREPYNLTKLLYHIVHSIPAKKRLALADHVNKKRKNWRYDDGEDDYKGNTLLDFFDDVKGYMLAGADTGRNIGKIVLGKPGELIGAIIGGTLGAIGGFFSRLFG